MFAVGGSGHAGATDGVDIDTDHTRSDPAEEAALDAYSRVVTTVAARVPPSVAALSVRTPRGAGAGSAVTDGLPLTSAHVVQGSSANERWSTGLQRLTRGPAAPRPPSAPPPPPPAPPI
ncbi:hypothetical protein [Micromonospora sp. NBC_01638]|uniref:hypothetical protein n=1 Tax=Micromonospora sp. NBC_01638 TaxID=2975982 RepID=UPI003866D8CF|nr:hypothetical protein OG811_15235 [Micromonospora sp. NBC_01638]